MPGSSSFSSSSLLVSVQLSVFSSWRLAHTAKIARKVRSEATTISAIATAACPGRVLRCDRLGVFARAHPPTAGSTRPAPRARSTASPREDAPSFR